MNEKTQIWITVPCPECNGTGGGGDQWDLPDLSSVFVNEWICSMCFGEGTIKVKPQ